MSNVSSDDANALESVSQKETVAAVAQTLRWWPALLLLVSMVGVRLMLKLFEAPSLPVIMIGFMGPAAVGLLVLVWWSFASRAGLREKLIGLFGFLVIAGIGIAAMDPSMQGFGLIVLVIPTTVASFALGLILLANRPKFRVPVAFVLSVFVLGYWNLLQSEGVTGQFEAVHRWRWEPTAEELFLKQLAESDPSATTADEELPEAEWPAFRGANRDGVVLDVALAEDWETTPPKEIWRTRVGPGWSSFSVAGQRIFTQEQRGDNEAVVCLDAETGKAVWDYSYPSRFWEAAAGAGPRATPTIEGQHLYALGANGMLVCLDAVTGKKVWERDLHKDANREPPQWGFAASPLVVDDLVIVHAGGSDEKGVFAYSAETGDLAWSVASGDHSYSSAQLAMFDSARGLLMMTNVGLQFLKVEDGTTIWEYPWKIENYRTLQPLVEGDSIVIASSLGEGTRKITVSQNDSGEWDLAEVWTTLDMKSDFNDFVAHEGSLYGFDRNIFACVDLETGERAWKRGRYGNGQVLLLPQADQLLVISENGELVLLDATPEKLDERARFQAIDGKTWNHPVLVGQRLYVRNAEEAACFELPIQSE